MSDERYFKFSNGVLLVPMVAILLVWTIFWLELHFRVNLNAYGIYPRTFTGMKGIFFSPFIHGSIEHLYNNTFPIIILTASLVYFYRDVAFKVIFWGIVVSGFLTWIIGRPSFHIGASGLIYVLASFIFFKGIFTRHYRLVALSLMVVFIYGSLLWYIFPIKEGISWEGHLAGFITGLAMAALLKTKIPQPVKYRWEEEDYDEDEDEFLKHFDKDGNFIERRGDDTDPASGQVKIKYHYKPGKPNED